MKTQKPFPWRAYLGGALVVGMMIGLYSGISSTVLIVAAVIGGLLLGWMALWQHANANARGDEWWQDDSASGWRGY